MSQQRQQRKQQRQREDSTSLSNPQPEQVYPHMAKTNSNIVPLFNMGPYGACIVLNVTRFCHKEEKRKSRYQRWKEGEARQRERIAHNLKAFKSTALTYKSKAYHRVRSKVLQEIGHYQKRHIPAHQEAPIPAIGMRDRSRQGTPTWQYHCIGNLLVSG